jgi:hypothetical protein
MPKLNRTGKRTGSKTKPKVELGSEKVTSEFEQEIENAKKKRCRQKASKG